FTSHGPALFRQTRVGRDGREFRMLKYRTMIVGAEEQLDELRDRAARDHVLFKLPDDPRLTRLGRWLRRHSLDELPQLWNVVKGDMSVVGPRPPLPSEVEVYADDARRRLLVKPGLTGLWQVSGRADLGENGARGRQGARRVLTSSVVPLARRITRCTAATGSCEVFGTPQWSA